MCVPYARLLLESGHKDPLAHSGQPVKARDGTMMELHHVGAIERAAATLAARTEKLGPDDIGLADFFSGDEKSLREVAAFIRRIMGPDL